MASIIPVTGTPGLQNIEGEYIALKPLTEAIGIGYVAQYEKLQEAEWATIRLNRTVGADGKSREMATLHKDAVPMWLATIQPSRVKPEVRPVLIAYQKEAAKALNDYFTKGVAVNPRHLGIEEQARVLQALIGVLPQSRLSVHGEIVAARALGNAPDIAPQDIPLYVEDYLKEMNRTDISSSSFGRKVANEYRKETGEEPPMEHAVVAGRPRKVKAYTETHRPIFDKALATYPTK